MSSSTPSTWLGAVVGRVEVSLPATTRLVKLLPLTLSVGEITPLSMVVWETRAETNELPPRSHSGQATHTPGGVAVR